MKKTLITTISMTAMVGLLFGLVPLVEAKNDNSNKGRGKEIKITKTELRNEFRSLREEIRNRISRSSNFNTNLTLIQQNGSPINGTAKIKANLKNSGLYQTKIEVKLFNIPSTTTSTVFEAWLVDENGYNLSLGAFTNNGRSGKANFEFEGNLHNLKIYDRLMITEEPIFDVNGNPNRTILSVAIPESFADVGLKATLRGSFEVPTSSTSTAQGTGVFVLNTASNTLKFDISYFGLIGTETAAHIHGPATSTQTAGVLFTLPTGTPKIGIWNYQEHLENDILSGRTYVNIHSSVYPDGEIRGQIVTK